MIVGDCFKGGLISESFSLLRGSSHIRNVLIGIKYRNCRWTLDVYCLFTYCYLDRANSIKTNLWACNLHTSPLTTSPLSNFDWICPIQIAKHKTSRQQAYKSLPWGTYFLEDLSKSEKLSKIKLPLASAPLARRRSTKFTSLLITAVVSALLTVGLQADVLIENSTIHTDMTKYLILKTEWSLLNCWNLFH